MFNFLLGWQKASKCKKLIKSTQCRLKLLKTKRSAIIRLLKEDIGQLLKTGHEEIAFKKLDQLYMDENWMSIYEILDNFSEFMLLNLRHIRRHRDIRHIPNDLNEALSTLIFVSARITELPELRIIRKLIMERYGEKFVNVAVELHTGNFVNCQVSEKFTQHPIPQDVKNRMVDEIVRDYFFKQGQLAIEYRTGPAEQRTPDIKTGSSSENSMGYTEMSVIYLDDVEEFKSPIRNRSQSMDLDQRGFIFKMAKSDRKESHKEQNRRVSSYNETLYIVGVKSNRKRMRRKSVSKEKQTVNDAQGEIYYSSSPHSRRKYQKKAQGSDCASRQSCTLERQPVTIRSRGRHQPERAIECTIQGGEIRDIVLSSPINQTRRTDLTETHTMSKSVTRPHVVRAVTMPQNQEVKSSRAICRMGSLPVEKASKGACRNLASPSHVHPKLPDYDEIAEKFMALKKAHQKNKCAS